jgi:hypothetical protein
VPTNGAGSGRILSKGFSPARWSLDGKTLYVALNVQDQVAQSGLTVALPTGPDDQPLSPMPADSAGGLTIPHQNEGLWLSQDPSTYVYLKSERRQNIYRIPLH